MAWTTPTLVEICIGLDITAICAPSSHRIGKSDPPPADAASPAGGGYLCACPLCRRLPAGRVIVPNSLHQPGPQTSCSAAEAVLLTAISR